MKIRESCLQNGTFIYKAGISLTKQDFKLQNGTFGIQTGFSACYLDLHMKNQLIKQQISCKMRGENSKTREKDGFCKG